VLGRFPQWNPDDSILLANFAGERDDSSKTSRNRFRLATSPKPKWAKKRAFQQKLAEEAPKNLNFVSEMIKKHVSKFLQKWLHEAFYDFSHTINGKTFYCISEFLLNMEVKIDSE
jgi:hypothetical protein